jgi:hypothetical protein
MEPVLELVPTRDLLQEVSNRFAGMIVIVVEENINKDGWHILMCHHSRGLNGREDAPSPEEVMTIAMQQLETGAEPNREM